MKMSAQQIYDKVATHLIEQGAKSTLPNGWTCAYRGSKGRKCAAGVLILDAFYVPNLEFNNVRTGDVSGTLEDSGVGLAHLGLVEALQSLHDDTGVEFITLRDSYEVEDWPYMLALFAAERGLNMDALEAACVAKFGKEAA